MKVKLKKAVEVPPPIQALADTLVKSKHDELPILLHGFKWTYDKGDFNHWVPLFNFFDDVLEEAIKDRPELNLSDSTPQQQPGPFPVETCLAVLRTTAIILEHCSNKHLYQSYDRVAALLVLEHDEVVCAALRTLEAFVRKTHSASVRWQGIRELNSRLSAMCHVWGGGDQGLDMTTCASEGATPSKQALAEATTLRFQFHPVHQPDSVYGPVTITIPCMDRLGESAHVLAQRLWQQHSIPLQQRFLLLSKIRVAIRMGTLEGRRAVVTQRLMAHNVLMMSTPTPEDLAPLVAPESEFVSDLVSLIAAESTVLEPLRALALRAIAVQLQDRGRHTAIIAAMNSGGQSGFLSLLLHRSIASLVATTSAAAAVQAAGGEKPASELALPSHTYSLEFVESLLILVQCLAISPAGGAALADAGVIAALMPLLRSRHPDHVGLVAAAVKVLEGYIDINVGAATVAFSESNGLQELIGRLAYEVGAGEGDAAKQDAAAAGPSNRASSAVASPAGCPAQLAAASAEGAASNSINDAGGAAAGYNSSSSIKLPYARTTLIKFLLRCLALACFSPQSTAAGRPPESVMVQLYRSLGVMLRDAGRFGGSLFALAASVVSDCLHSDPLQYRLLDEEGLPQAYLDAVNAGLLPSSDAVCTIPGMLVAFCLNTGGLARVKEQRVLEALIPIFTCRKYAKALSGDAAVMIGAGLEELFRFTPSLLPDGVDVVINIIRAVCVLGGDEAETLEAKVQTELKLTSMAAAALAAVSTGEVTTAGRSPVPLTELAAAGGAATVEGAAEPMEMDNADTAICTDMDAALTSTDGALEASTALAPVSDGSGSTNQTSGEAAVPAASPGTSQAMELDSGAAHAVADEGTVAPSAFPPAGGPAVVTAAGPVPYDFTAVLAEAPTIKDSDSFLTEALSHVTRMLEGLVTHMETSRLLVERGLIGMMLKINHLPRLSFTFAFSSPSHPLLSVARALAPNHAAVTSAKTTEALTVALPVALERVSGLGPTACVPALPASERGPYLKAVASAAGLITLASVIARTSTTMLQLLSMGPDNSTAVGRAALPNGQALAPQDTAQGREAATTAASGQDLGAVNATPVEPVLVTMGRLERALMAQADIADAWAMQRADVEKTGSPESMAATGGSADSAMAMTADAPAGAATGTGGSSTGGDDLAVVDTDGTAPTAPLANGDQGVGGPAAGVSSKSRRSPEELSHDVLHHSLLAIRTFYVAVAKAIHTSSRRTGREDPASVLPTLGMRSAALCLAINMKGNLDLELPLISPPMQAVGVSVTGISAGGAKAAVETAPTPAVAGGDQDAMAVDSGPGVDAAAVLLNRRAVHLQRLADEVNYLLLDSRRRSCHVLLLNYFVGIGSMDSLSRRFEQAADNMWSVLAAQVQTKAGIATDRKALQAPSHAAGSAGEEPRPGASQGVLLARDAAMVEDSTAEDVAVTSPSAVAPEAAGGAGAVTGAVASVGALVAEAGPAVRVSTSAVSAAVRRDPVSMAEKCLASYLTVYEQLSNATTVFSSPQAAVLLTTGLPSGAGSAMLDQIKDPVELMKSIQSRIMASVLPVWRQPSLANCSPTVVAALVNIIRLCAEGTSTASSVLMRSNAIGGRAALGGALGRPQFVPDPAHVQTIVEMGFSATRAEEAIRRVGANSVEAAMEWLVMHPEEPVTAVGGAGASAAGGTAMASASTPASAAPAQDDDSLLGACLTTSLAGIGQQPFDLHPPAAASAGLSGTLAGDAAAAGAPTSRGITDAASTAVAIGRPGIPQLVEGALAIIARSSTGTGNLSDLLSTLACRDAGKERGAVVSELLSALGRAASAANVGSYTGGGGSKELLAAARLVLMLLTRDAGSAEVTAKAGAAALALGLLEEWMNGYIVRVAALPPVPAEVPGSNGSALSSALSEELLKGLSVPVWVEALLLLLEILSSTAPRRAPHELLSSGSRAAVAATAVPSTAAGASGSSGATAAADSTVVGGAAARPTSPERAATEVTNVPGWTSTGGDTGPIVLEHIAATPARNASAADTGAAVALTVGRMSNAASGAVPTLLALPSALMDALSAWRPCGLLSDEEQGRAMRLCTTLLQHLQAHGDKWCPPLRLSAVPSEEILPSPSSATQAVLQLLGRLTRKHSNAAAAAAAGIPRLLLRLPSSCLLPNTSRHEPYMLFILRHVLEDPVTLGGWMEAEFRNYFAQRARGQAPMFGLQHRAQQTRADAVVSMSSFLSSMSRLLNRDPYVFLEVMSRCCSLDPHSPLIRLKKPEQQQPQTAGQASGQAAGEPARSTSEGGGNGAAAMDATPAPAPMLAGTAAAGATPIAGLVGPDGAKTPGLAVQPIMPLTVAKVTRKSVPASFVDVIDALVDVIMSYKGPPPAAAEPVVKPASSPQAMEVDNAPMPVEGVVTEAGAVQQVPAIVDATPTLSAAAQQQVAELQLQVLLRKSSETVMQRLALRFLTEFSLLFSPTLGLLLKRDEQLAGVAAAAAAAEAASPSSGPTVDAGKGQHGPPHAAIKGERKDDKERNVHAQRDKDSKEREDKTPHTARRAAAAATGTGGKGALETVRKQQQQPNSQGHAHGQPVASGLDAATGQHRAGALLRHLIHVQLVCGDQSPGCSVTGAAGMSLTEKVNELLQAICVRSVEGRRRIISEVVATLAVAQLPPGALEPAHRDLILQAPPGQPGGPAGPYEERPGYPAPAKIRAVVQLVGVLVENSGAASALDARRGGNNAQGAGAISTEIVRAMREHGMVPALTAALCTINMEHPRAQQAVQAIMRPLEMLTRNAAAWASKLAGSGGLGRPLASKPVAARLAASARQPEGAGTSDTAMDDEARAEAGPAALRAMGRRGGSADPMVDMLISRIDRAMEDMGARHVGTSSEEDEDEDVDAAGIAGGRRRQRRGGVAVADEHGDEGEDEMDDLDDMEEDDEEEEGEEDEDEEDEGGEGELADELQMQRLQDEMSEDAEAEEGFSDGEDDPLLHGPQPDDDLAGIEDVDIGDDEDDDGEVHEDEDEEGEDGEEESAGDLGEGGAEELVEEEEDVEGDDHDPHDPFADPHNGPGDGNIAALGRDGEMAMAMADGVDQDEDDGEDRGEDEDDGNGGEVEDEDDDTERDYDEEDYDGADDGGDGRGGRLFMEAGPDSDMFPVVIRGARRSPGGTLTAQFHVPGDLDDLGLNGGVPRAGLNALAEILQAGDWGGGTGRRNRTFRWVACDVFCRITVYCVERRLC
ncbi:hypothetical protein Vretimale_18444 [Volvox reticuliferus]|uniref:Uncharacterized protein n=1 Tax=Volvox reticuliferus TaxID=1737510 RepID=A0A8J4CZN0_9CHLO|nr:hypothetical protein Vretifemale_19831 [Volvox reticuliferus]GIM15694.1 hypothetical protein Vretimale_18444 [Volvox reticuliferus]